ncbi:MULTISPECIES: sensor histidine kinase [Sphingobacterium]|uniref:sensor histidine kinase n=1 Tax=Sphingobacterium TaxID=28453 RepID=UPI001F08EEA6|nr:MULTISPECIES: HAMP domain-containing sensor histidine kinase [unclassified Sphingobacterium]
MSLIFTQTDTNALLNEVFKDLQTLAKERNLKYELSLPRITLTADVDSEAIWKIFTNLIHNAIKYAYRIVHIKLLPFNSDDIMFNIEFGNDGPIIPFDKKDKIFEPFYRLHDVDKNTGTGIAPPSFTFVSRITLWCIILNPYKGGTKPIFICLSYTSGPGFRYSVICRR